MPVTPRQALRLVRPLAPAISWAPIAPAGGLALLLVWLRAQDAYSGPEELIVALRAAAILLAVAAAFSLDDAAAGTTASTPSPLLLRRTVRVALVALPTTALWAGALWLAARKPLPEPSSLPVALLSLELATIIMITLALAAAVIRWGDSNSGGLAASSALLGLTVLTWLIPEGVRPWVYPGEPQWAAAHRWWAVALIASLAWFVWAGLDPRRRRRPQGPAGGGLGTGRRTRQTTGSGAPVQGPACREARRRAHCRP
ncbi:hypothetical protein BH23ACT7_BH23ACT7_16050 [soil metagenome]